MKICTKRWIAPAIFGAFGLGLSPFSMAENPFIQTYYSPDPAPVVFGDTLCVYTGNDEGGSFFTMHGWRVSCTEDMVNWTDRGTLILESQDFNGSAKKNGDWAAQVVRRDGTYYYYVTVESTKGGRAINVATSDKVEGPFKDALNGRHLAGPNWDYIDPTVLIDDDGQAWLYWGNPKLYYCPLKDNMIECKEEIKVADMDSFKGKYTEGPWIHKRGKKYYMIYAAAGVPETIDYSWGDSPTGPWEYKGTIMPGGQSFASFTNHSGIIDFKGRSFFFYHGEKRSDEYGSGGLPSSGGYSRTSRVEEFTWNADGTIPTIYMTAEGVTKPIKNLDPYGRVEAETKSWVQGISVDVSGGYTIINNIETEGGRVYLTNVKNGGWTKVSSVDMSDGADRIVMCTKGGAATIELHSGSATGPLMASMNIPASDSWAETSYEVTGADDVANLFFVFKSGNTKFDYWYLESDKQAVPQEPFGGKAYAIPGVIQAENFDKPGVGRGNKSFQDNDAENHGDSDYRAEDAPSVDLYKKGEDGKTIVVGYIQKDEWLEYTVDVAEAGDYTMYAAVASAGGSTFKMSLDEADITADVEVPKATVEDSYDEYVKVKANVTLPAGKHILRFTATGDWFDVDYFNFEKGKDAEDKAPIGFVEGDEPPDFSGAVSGVNFARKVDTSCEVFGLTGKLLGRINLVGGDVLASLKTAGFGKGVYMVRGVQTRMLQVVKVK